MDIKQVNSKKFLFEEMDLKQGLFSDYITKKIMLQIQILRLCIENNIEQVL